MKNSINILFLCFGLLLVAACEFSEKGNTANNEQLLGTWICVGGMYDGTASDMLNGAEITFDKEELNFPELVQLDKKTKQAYILEGKEIKLSEDKDFVLTIKKQEENTMTIGFMAMGHALEMNLEKK